MPRGCPPAGISKDSSRSQWNRVCVEADNGPLLLPGGTLFQDSIGRTDPPGGDFATITHSIKQRLYTLDPDTAIIRSHGADELSSDKGFADARDHTDLGNSELPSGRCLPQGTFADRPADHLG